MTQSHARRFAVPLAGVVFSVASVVLLLRLANPADIAVAMRSAHPGYVALLAIVLLGSYPLRSYRWFLVLLPVVRARQRDVLSATAVGLLGNNLLPARLGEVGRSLLIARHTGISRMTAVATVAGERMLDTGGVLAILAALVFAVGVPGLSRLWTARGSAVMLWALVVLAAAAALAVWMTRRSDGSGGIRLPAAASRIVDGLRVFTDARVLAHASAWTMALWILLGCNNYFGLLALGIHLPWHAPFVIMVAQVVGVAIPSSPGYIGTYHVATVFALSLYDVPPEAAVSFAVITHAVGVIVAVVAGVPCLWYEGLSGRDLWRWRAVEREVVSIS